jgi:hypothetical protein
MRKVAAISALACLALAVIVFVFADGARAVYSGLFFIMLAVVFFITDMSPCPRSYPDSIVTFL